MSINFFTVLWAVIGLLSIVGFFVCNGKVNLINFLTKREHLLLILIAALLGMREYNFLAFAIFIGAVYFIYTKAVSQPEEWGKYNVEK